MDEEEGINHGTSDGGLATIVNIRREFLPSNEGPLFRSGQLEVHWFLRWMVLGGGPLWTGNREQLNGLLFPQQLGNTKFKDPSGKFNRGRAGPELVVEVLHVRDLMLEEFLPEELEYVL